MTPNIKKITKTLAKYLGVQRPVSRIYQKLMSRKFQSIERLVINVDDIRMIFSIKDPYSKEWLLRYHDGGIHEEPVTRLMLQALKDAKCFVDIGTNLGWYTLLASKRMPNGVVYGFELDELNYDLLKQNIEMNHCRNITAIHAAVSDHEGTVQYARKSHKPSSVFRILPDSSAESPENLVEVPALTLDGFIADTKIIPDVIKIDVEGAEAKVLLGMKKILAQGNAKLFLEIHPKWLPAFQASVGEILGLLIDNGYEIHEVQEMRRPGSHSGLRALSKNSTIDENTMLYAEKRAT